MSDKKILELRNKLKKRIRDCQHGNDIGTSCGCDRIKCSEPNCQAYPWLSTITSHFYKAHPDLTAKFRLESGFAPFNFACSNCQKRFEEGEDKGPYHFTWNSGRLEQNEQFCEACALKFKESRKLHQARLEKSGKKELKNMSQLKKIKTVKKTVKKTMNLSSQSKPVKKKITKAKSTPVLAKPRSVRSKENTLAYYNCLIDQVANNDKVKITKLCNWCSDNKGKVVWSKEESKRELVDKVARSYLEFGKGLGHLLHANVVKECQCKG